MRGTIRTALAAYFDPVLVDELLAAYSEAKANFYEGGHRLSAVEGGRFCEAAFRMLEQVTTTQFTPLNKSLDTEQLIRQLARSPGGQVHRSIALYIPRALRVVYDIRNNRDAAHLADGIDPNLQDATLVIATLNWVLAEFVRLYHAVSANEAQAIVEELTVRRVPIIQEFGTFPKVLRPDLRASDMVLILLYHAGQGGATYQQLSSWVRSTMRANLRRTLWSLDEKALVHFAGGTATITTLGTQSVEERKLLQP